MAISFKVKKIQINPINFIFCMEEEKKESISEEVKTNWTQEIKRFDELGLSDELLRGIYGYGYELPS